MASKNVDKNSLHLQSIKRARYGFNCVFYDYCLKQARSNLALNNRFCQQAFRKNFVKGINVVRDPLAALATLGLH